jgi:hypothetical protein
MGTLHRPKPFDSDAFTVCLAFPFFDPESASTVSSQKNPVTEPQGFTPPMASF